MLKRFFHFLLFLIRGGPARVAFETKNNCSESGQTMTEFLHQSVKTCNARLVCCYSGAQPKPSNTAAARTFLTVPGAKNLYEPNWSKMRFFNMAKHAMLLQQCRVYTWGKFPACFYIFPQNQVAYTLQPYIQFRCTRHNFMGLYKNYVSLQSRLNCFNVIDYSLEGQCSADTQRSSKASDIDAALTSWTRRDQSGAA